MAPQTYETTPTRFVEANGIRYAYRSLGKESGTPLVFLHHFRGTLDNWDSAVVNGNHDIMIPTINSYILAQHLPNAQLILYPDAGHGSFSNIQNCSSSTPLCFFAAEVLMGRTTPCQHGVVQTELDMEVRCMRVMICRLH